MTPTTCTESGCDGTISADGYCDTCGAKGRTAATTPPAPPAVAPAGGHSTGDLCDRNGCAGRIAADNYCDTCGLAAGPPRRVGSPTAMPSTSSSLPGIAAAAPPDTSARIATTGSTSRRQSRATRTGTARQQLGAGLVRVAATPTGDPAAAVMSDEKIAGVLGVVDEADRVCSSCGNEVGRGADGKPGRVEGFCSSCRTPFNFVTNAPTLSAGEVVSGQYEILGPIAHGGMGWIYLGRDRAVSDRWVVLKGLLSSADEDAALAAVAERRYLARIDHPNIVNIYNFATHRGSGYIVMEFVGGESLNGKLKARRKANGGVPDPLDLREAIAYILGVIPAFGYLHDIGLAYNDLKPANIMVVGEGVKLIDVGAVMQMDDDDAAIFGTRGFQAPEVATLGPSPASDLYTIGRTLAVLILNFVFHSGPYEYELPPATAEPLFLRWESLHRFLLKATAEHPDDRFQTADEMANQLTGVLREIVAISEQTPRAGTSLLFHGDGLPGLIAAGDDDAAFEARWQVLPHLRVDPEDPAAAFLESLPTEPADALTLMASADPTIATTREFALAQARLHLEAGTAGEVTILDRIEADDPWEWRVRWYRSLRQLINGDPDTAAEGFGRVWTEVPGEVAPKLAVALAAELAEAYPRAATMYDLVLSADSAHVSAAFGLARCHEAMGDREAAIAAFNRVPASSAAYFDAQVGATRALIDDADGKTDMAALATASAAVERLQLDAVERTKLSAEILERALRAVDGNTIPAPGNLTLFGKAPAEGALREQLESVYREQARLATTAGERYDLVDKANRVRRRSWF